MDIVGANSIYDVSIKDMPYPNAVLAVHIFKLAEFVITIASEGE